MRTQTGDAARRRLRFDRGLAAATFVVLAVLFVALTVLFGHLFRGARLDLTANRLYTLSSGTERLVAGLQEPMDLYFYFSRAAAEPVPQLLAYATRVRELLEEIAAAKADRSLETAERAELLERSAGLVEQLVLDALRRERLEFGVDGAQVRLEPVQPRVDCLELCAQRAFLLRRVYVHWVTPALGGLRGFLDDGQRDPGVALARARGHDLLHHAEGDRLVREDRHLLAFRDRLRAQADDVLAQLGETHADRLDLRAVARLDVRDAHDRHALHQDFVPADEDHDRLAWLRLDHGVRQSDLLRLLQHLGRRRVHQQEEHQDGEHVHQRRQVEPGNGLLVARHARDAA
jgi:hypothetical protein